MHEDANIKANWKQNHRMVGVGRNLWRSSSPTSLLKQDHLEQAALDHVQEGFEYVQRRRLHNPSWAACSSTLSLPKQRSSSSCSDGTSYASVCARCPLCCRWAPLKRVWPRPRHPPLYYLNTMFFQEAEGPRPIASPLLMQEQKCVAAG